MIDIHALAARFAEANASYPPTSPTRLKQLLVAFWYSVEGHQRAHPDVDGRGLMTREGFDARRKRPSLTIADLAAIDPSAFWDGRITPKTVDIGDFVAEGSD